MLSKGIIAIVALGLGGGCGGPAKASSTGPSCDEVAQKMLRLAMDDNGVNEAPPELNGLKDEMRAQCQEAAWSQDRRQCILDAKTQEDTISCPLQ